jgi:hypothetical protein
MTANANNSPISVDYTGRDYYALRDQLIDRVKYRVNGDINSTDGWQGNDPSDFGLALVEAFAYMGDLVNYYIDRVANETYLLTATQRESLLNIASMYGYKPANYVSASVTLDITNNGGYKSTVGGAIIESDANNEINNPGLGNYVKVIVASNNPFTADATPAAGKYNEIRVLGVPEETTVSIGDKTLTYNISPINGTYPVKFVGYDNFGSNVVWYRPSATVSALVPNTAIVTAASGNGTTVTYASDNNFTVGQVVTITNLGITSGTTLNLSDVTIATAEPSYFTVTNSTVGVSSGSGTATDSTTFVMTLNQNGQTLIAHSGQKILVSGVTVGSGVGYNGKWIVKSTTDPDFTKNIDGKIIISSKAMEATVTAATVTSTDTASVMYSAWNDFTTSNTVTITNLANTTATVTAASAGYTASSVTATVTAASGNGTTVTYTAANTSGAGNAFSVGDYVSITGLSTSAFNLTQVAIATRSDTGFTVTNAATGTAVTGASATATIQLPTVTYTAANTFSAGQIVTITGVSADFNLTNVRVNAVSPAVSSTQFTVLNAATGTAVTGASGTATVAGTVFNLSNKAVTSSKDYVSEISRFTRTTVGSNSDLWFFARMTDPATQYQIGHYVTIRNIYSSGNPNANVGSGYNLTDQLVADIKSDFVKIDTITGDTAAIGRLTINTVVGDDGDLDLHGIKVGDFVNISGVANKKSGVVTRTDVYNVKGAKVLTAGDHTFTVAGYWAVEYDEDNSVNPAATTHAFKLVGAGTSFGSKTSPGGIAISKWFKVANTGSIASGTSTNLNNGKATPKVGGTYASGGDVVYANLPTLLLTGPYATNNVPMTVPKGTQVVTQVTADGKSKDVIFSTQSETVIPARSTESVLAIHGEEVALRTDNAADLTKRAYDIAGELLGYSTGDAYQSFSLKEVEVSPRSVRIFIDTGVQWDEWTQVEHIEDYDSSSKIFEIAVSSDEVVHVNFGDGISGQIPTKEAGIKATYIAGGGTIGNVGAASLATWGYIPGTDATFIRNNMAVTNSEAANGGTNPESNDSIRYNAPRSLRALNRAVTLDDFANLALSVDGIVKANAYAQARSSVSLYVAPNGAEDDPTPGLIEGVETVQMGIYRQLVTDYLADRKQIGTTVSIFPPKYSKVQADLAYSVLPQYNVGIVETAIKTKLLEDFSFANMSFGDVITPEEIEFKLRQVEGVSNIRVSGLYRELGYGRNSLIGEPDEIFVFSGDTIGLTPTSSDALLTAMPTFIPLAENLSTLSADNLGFTPTFAPGVYSYSLTLPLNTKKLNFTFAASNKATVAVNDVIQTYTSTTSLHGLPNNDAKVLSTNLSSFIVTVTAEDGLSSNTYRFKYTVSLT